MKAGDLPLLLTGVDQSELDGEVLADHHPILLYHLNLYILDQEQKKQGVAQHVRRFKKMGKNYSLLRINKQLNLIVYQFHIQLIN